ncbi:hypothetical protein TNCV_1357801 [Trichonephila clavipes]|uniref:Uncharacterized protein n=1 Tax=Trichonephila clavipes TaxID=2585209 RepID=A0A8X6VDA0_TRICX|nr:hypothetical protein TNCV_1357801 [Trichonephila clavipes]
MPAIEITTTFNIRSETNSVFQNSYSYQIIYFNSSTPLTIHMFCRSYNTIRISKTCSLIDTAPAPSNSLSTSVSSYSSNRALSSSAVSMFSPLPLKQVMFLKLLPLHPTPYFLHLRLQNKLQKFAGKRVLTEVLPQK